MKEKDTEGIEGKAEKEGSSSYDESDMTRIFKAMYSEEGHKFMKNEPKSNTNEEVKSDVEMWLKKDGAKFLRSVGVGKGQVVLDFGCGEGHYSIPASKLVGEEGKIYALDKDKQALNSLVRQIKKNHIKNIKVIQAESKISLKDNCIDFILSYDVLHYVKNRKDIYAEFCRVLRPNGIFSLYPKHLENDYPLMELAHMKLEEMIDEVKQAGFSLQAKFFKKLIHDDSYNDGCILNFKKSLS